MYFILQVESWQGGGKFAAKPSPICTYFILQVESWQGGAKFAAKPSLSLALYMNGFLLQGQSFKPYTDQVYIASRFRNSETCLFLSIACFCLGWLDKIASTLHRKFELCIPRKETAQPLSPDFHIHVSVSDVYIFTHDRSTYFPAAE
jgi:hypothetical protein